MADFNVETLSLKELKSLPRRVELCHAKKKPKQAPLKPTEISGRMVSSAGAPGGANDLIIPNAVPAGTGPQRKPR